MAVKYRGNGVYTCLAADTKPATAMASALITETDSRKVSFYDTVSAQWIPYEWPSFNRYRIFKIGSTTYVTTKDNKVISSGTDTADVIQAVLDTTTTNNVYQFDWDAGQWIMTKPIELPTVASAGAVKKVIMRGAVPNWERGTAGYTRLLADVTWPTDHYFFEMLNPTLAAINGDFIIENFGASLGNATQAKNVGFLLVEAGDLNLGRFYHQARNLHLEYMWRSIHIKGMSWFGIFENIFTTYASTGFVADAQFVIEDGGIVNPELNPSPKACLFRNISQSAGEGVANNYIRMKDGGYHKFEHIFVDGKFFNESVFRLGGPDGIGSSKNLFVDCSSLDLEFPDPNTSEATLKIESYVSVGNECYDNTFINCHFSNYPEAILLEGDGTMDNRIEVDAIWGTAMTRVTDTTADPTNVITVYGRANPGVAHGKLTHTGGTSRVIDLRRGAEKSGFTSVADGGTISHSLFTTPLWVQVTPSVAGEIASVTAKGTTTFTVALKKISDGSAGTTQSVYWRAGVYA